MLTALDLSNDANPTHLDCSSNHLWNLTVQKICAHALRRATGCKASQIFRIKPETAIQIKMHPPSVYNRKQVHLLFRYSALILRCPKTRREVGGFRPLPDEV